MNTPKSRPTRIVGRLSRKTKPLPEGKWEDGIKSQKHAELVGQFITTIPHVEEAMIPFLACLLGRPHHTGDIAAQVFRSMRSEQARIDMMRALLQEAISHYNKPAIFDEVIDLFSSIKNRRNIYAHALWFTHESGDVYLTEAASDFSYHNDRRKITVKVIEQAIDDIDLLFEKIDDALKWAAKNPLPHGYTPMLATLTRTSPVLRGPQIRSSREKHRPDYPRNNPKSPK